MPPAFLVGYETGNMRRLAYDSAGMHSFATAGPSLVTIKSGKLQAYLQATHTTVSLA